MKYKSLNVNADYAKIFKENYYKMMELNDKLWDLDNRLDMVQTQLNFLLIIHKYLKSI